MRSASSRNLSAGNPDLQPQHAWNVDLLGEHFIGSSGVLSGGVFYKAISDFIYRAAVRLPGAGDGVRRLLRHAPGERRQRPPARRRRSTTRSGSTCLPGVLSGLGVDVNWTHIDSRAELLADTASTAATLGAPGRSLRAARASGEEHRATPRSPTTLGPVSCARAWQYQGAIIYAYGDGSASPSGDNWFFPHSQIDAALTLTLRSDVAVQVQALNLNNAVFGFYNGLPGSEFSNQREYYGRSLILGVRYGFGGRRYAVAPRGRRVELDPAPHTDHLPPVSAMPASPPPSSWSCSFGGLPNVHVALRSTPRSTRRRSVT